MEIPTSFQLMGHRWTVIHVLGMIRDPGDGDECRGLCQFDELTIQVNIAQPESMVMHTFMHEVMHAVFWALGRSEVSDENMVDSIGGALAQVLDSVE